ncbi:nucleotide exchange factor GrpE [Pendulispora albinea]|uniref:Protein GrpE n=1 Tax=Pendulispora albinea TaxID=2741071 RepID=A0ABZ2M001_9BACT
MTEKEVNNADEAIGPSSPDLGEEKDASVSTSSTTSNAPKSTGEAGEACEDALAEARLEAARLKDMWMRTAAEFDNFRKRSRRETDDARKLGQEEILRELLPVFDNIERGIQGAQRAQEVKAVVDGLQMILKQFESTLGKINIKKVPSVGTPFDPAVHEAIQQVETDQHPSGTVIFEVQPGYLQGEKLVRAAMVVVAKAKSVNATGQDGSANGTS